MRPTYYEFFSGAGMVRAGLGPQWNCLFSNDHDEKKGRLYRFNWGSKELRTADIKSLTADDLPGVAELAWASFPCQDLSLAGVGAGLKGDRSGTFWPFWKLMESLIAAGRAPGLIVLENVCGTLTAHEGKDFAAICEVFAKANYRVGALVVDAALFVPQSRPRLFIVGVKNEVELPVRLTSGGPTSTWHSTALKTAFSKLPASTKSAWVWWNLPAPQRRQTTFADVIEDHPSTVDWFSETDTQRLLDLMSPINRAKVETAKEAGRKVIGAVYKRTRPNELGAKVQRAEVRFDDVAGCLRTPAGGSSRQVILVVDGCSVRARLISSRETARLMGLPDSYELPSNYNEAYHLTGDGVVVPVVRYLARNIFEPLLEAYRSTLTVAA